MDQHAVEQLREQIGDYPYFHAARILLLQALHKQHSPLYDQELRRNAVMVPSRASIFHLTEEPHYKVKEERKRYAGGMPGESHRQSTDQLIDNFLGSLPPRRSLHQAFPWMPPRTTSPTCCKTSRTRSTPTLHP